MNHLSYRNVKMKEPDMISLDNLRKTLEGRELIEKLLQLASLFKDKVLFTTSFGVEDQVISHLIFENNIPIKVATLDTGRLFPETYKVFNETLKKYRKSINVFSPDHNEVEKMVTEKGPLSFYYSKEDRLECCRYRKLEPLKRALEGIDCWISGIRGEQSENRSHMEQIEWDDSRRLYKFYPLFDWTFQDVMEYAGNNSVPTNILHTKGFLSIGCEPCTRAIKEGEDFRAGRWWWESGSEKECGLHLNEDKRLK
jgi:phosphoadenosine phosphosulfate reductase